MIQMKTFKSYGKQATGFTTLASWLMAGEEFKNQTGTLRGGPVEPSSFLSLGRLVSYESDAKEFMEANYRNLIDYVVYSYGTPIAYHVREDGKVKARWVEPAVKYSNTTTKHQGRVSVALNIAKVWSS